MDEMYLISKEDFPIRMHTNDACKDVLQMWHSDRLELETMHDFMDQNGHDLCDDDCYWCSVYIDVLQSQHSPSVVLFPGRYQRDLSALG